MDTKPGRTYGRNARGELIEVHGETPTHWICRRVENFPPGAIAKLPSPGFAICVGCHAPIVFNVNRVVDAEKICMQCADIDPLPWTEQL